MQTQWVDIQGEPLAYLEYHPEEHRADAILVHGFTGSKEDFDLIAPLLAQRGYRVITFDNRGQHESAHSDRSDAYSTNSIARDVIELVSTFNLERPHLFGHSLGGVIAQRAVAQAPQIFRSLTLMCSGPQARPNPPFPIMVRDIFTGMEMEDIWRQYLNKDLTSHPRYELMKKRWLASDIRSVLTHADELINFTSVLPEVAAAKIPSHVFYGERDDAWPFSMQLEMAEILGAKVDVIADAGHCPNEDQPYATAKVIADFWDKN